MPNREIIYLVFGIPTACFCCMTIFHVLNIATSSIVTHGFLSLSIQYRFLYVGEVLHIHGTVMGLHTRAAKFEERAWQVKYHQSNISIESHDS